MFLSHIVSLHIRFDFKWVRLPSPRPAHRSPCKVLSFILPANAPNNETLSMRLLSSRPQAASDYNARQIVKANTQCARTLSANYKLFRSTAHAQVSLFDHPLTTRRFKSQPWTNPGLDITEQVSFPPSSNPHQKSTSKRRLYNLKPYTLRKP